MLQVMTMSLTADTRRPARQELAEADVLGGRYELLDRVGRGGMSVVWRARDRVSDRLVAVKVLAEAYADDHELRQRLRQEAQVAAMVSSPYVAQASGCGEYQRGDRMAPFIVMEFVDGITLQDRLNAGPVLPAAAMRIGAQVASALAAIHEAAVVHCDIKPANVMLVGDAVKVVDFGIAARAGSEDTLSHPFQVLGTPAYMAPERLTGDAVLASADVYALGILLYRLLAGRSPWLVESTMQMLAAHVSEQPAPMPPLAEIPTFVASLCNQCLAKNPDSRPSAHDAGLLLACGARASADPRGVLEVRLREASAPPSAVRAASDRRRAGVAERASQGAGGLLRPRPPPRRRRGGLAAQPIPAGAGARETAKGWCPSRRAVRRGRPDRASPNGTAGSARLGRDRHLDPQGSRGRPENRRTRPTGTALSRAGNSSARHLERRDEARAGSGHRGEGVHVQRRPGPTAAETRSREQDVSQARPTTRQVRLIG